MQCGQIRVFQLFLVSYFYEHSLVDNTHKRSFILIEDLLCALGKMMIAFLIMNLQAYIALKTLIYDSKMFNLRMDPISQRPILG